MTRREALDGRIAGDVIARNDEEYEGTRQASVWNALKPDRYPDLIARATSVDDVVETVRFARERGLKLAVRGGGHSYVGASVRDGGVLLDLSALRELSVDAAAMTVSCQPAVTGLELSRALGDHGLGFPGGHCPSVALSGYILNGGIGWNPGVWGPATHSVRALELVTANGDVVVASEDENDDLFWAARGAGPSFPAVVTRYELQAHRLPRAITMSVYSYPLVDLAEIGDWVADIVPTLAPELELAIHVSTSRETGEKALTLFGVAWVDSEAEAASVLAPLDGCPALERASARHVGLPASFETLYEAMDAAAPGGFRYAVDTLWSAAPPGEVFPLLGERFAEAPSSRSLIAMVFGSPVAPAAPPPPQIAYAPLSGFLVLAYGIWDDPGADADNAAWVRDTFAAIEAGGVGHFVGESDLTVPGRLERSYTPEAWARVQEIRARRDPDGLFHGPLG